MAEATDPTSANLPIGSTQSCLMVHCLKISVFRLIAYNTVHNYRPRLVDSRSNLLEAAAGADASAMESLTPVNRHLLP